MDLVGGSATSEVEKEAAHAVRAGYVGALATPRVTDPTVERERERERGRERKQTLDDCVRRGRKRETEKQKWIIVITRSN
jgi:hypothetical protein